MEITIKKYNLYRNLLKRLISYNELAKNLIKLKTNTINKMIYN